MSRISLMLSLEGLRRFARDAVRKLRAERDLADFELYCSASEQFVIRFNYTSEIPCRGVEEAKSESAQGLALRIILRDPPNALGQAFEAGDLTLESLCQALNRARLSATVDPHFPGLPPIKSYTPLKRAASDLFAVSSSEIVKLGWDSILKAAIAELQRHYPAHINGSTRNFILSGDLTLTKERVVIARAQGDRPASDEDAHFRINLTAFDEATGGKSVMSRIGRTRKQLREALSNLASEIIAQAFKLANGQGLPEGSYKVVLSPQAVAEIVNYILLPSLTTFAFYTESSCFLGKFHQQVVDSRLTLIDNPNGAGMALRRHVSCEGVPARRVTLIRDGKLVGLLSDFYYASLLAKDEKISAKLGCQNSSLQRFSSGNGFRITDSGMRRFDAQLSTFASNVILSSKKGMECSKLIKSLGDGLYVGHIWYTYPINGQAAGDFTCTISGDSYQIRDGRMAVPLAPNRLRISGNLRDVFQGLLGVEEKTHAVALWGSPNVYYVPTIAVERLYLSEIEPPS